MSSRIDHRCLHRTAKYFMDSGRAETHDAAMALLQSFGLSVHVGPEIERSADHQTALLTLVNVARRTLLAGIDIVGLPDVVSTTPLAPGQSLRQAVQELGGTLVSCAREEWPRATIGTVFSTPEAKPTWRLTWEGWRGGVIGGQGGERLSESNSIAVAPALAAGACAAEAFAYFARDHAMTGHRGLGLSLWQPGADWLTADPSEPELAFLPSRVWLIGLRLTVYSGGIMSDLLTDRLNAILPRIVTDEFLSGSGIGNEIAFYIFDYPPENEVLVRDHVRFLMEQIPKRKPGLRVKHINLFDLIIEYLTNRKLLDRCFKMQREKGDEHLLRALAPVLDAEKVAEFFASTADPESHDMVLVSGVGSVFPLLRSHNLLNNLHSRMGKTPLVMFYPGRYDGQSLRLFGKLRGDNYYRAFKLVP